MPYPNLTGKHAYDALVTPQEMRASARAEGILPDLSAAHGAVLCYQSRITDGVAASGTATQFRGIGGETHLVDTGGDGSPIVVCGRFGIGAPAASIMLEELVALGIRRVVSVGTAGCLQRGMAVGDLVLCTGAIPRRRRLVPLHRAWRPRAARHRDDGPARGGADRRGR